MRYLLGSTTLNHASDKSKTMIYKTKMQEVAWVDPESS